VLRLFTKDSKTCEPDETLIGSHENSEQDGSVVFRRFDKEGLAQYRVHGRVPVGVEIFGSVNMDTAYREVWDDNLISLEDVQDNCERDGCYSKVVRWVERMLFPLSCREYIYQRYYQMIEDPTFGAVCLCYTDTALFDASGMDAPKGCVRAKVFRAVLAARERQAEGGGPFTEYILITSADLAMPIPAWLINYVVGTVLPKGGAKLRDACAGYEKWKTTAT